MPGHEAPPPNRPPESHGAVPASEADSMSTLLIAGLGVAVAAAIIAVIYVVMADGGAGVSTTPPPSSTAGADAGLPAPGQWTTTTEPSAGGGTDAFAMVASFETVSSSAGTVRPTLTARCAGGNRLEPRPAAGRRVPRALSAARGASGPWGRILAQ